MREVGSKRAFERSRRLSHGAVRRAILSGRLVRAVLANGEIDFEVADQELRENTRPSAPRLGSTNGAGHGSNGSGRPDPLISTQFAASRAVSEHLRARRLKLELDALEGKLVSVDEVRAALFTAVRQTKEILRGLPLRAAPMVVGNADLSEVTRVLEREVEHTIEALRSAFPPRPARAQEGA